MKKNKSLAIILSILLIIVLFVVLTSTIFCFKNVELNFLSNTIVLNEKNDEILNSGDFKFGKSIFFLNKNEIKNTLEEKNPYLKVINIETIFPNKIKINVIERNSLLCLKGYNEGNFSSFMIIDEDAKVLENLNSFSNTKLNPILVSTEGEKFEAFTAGQVYSGEYNQILKNLSTELLAYRSNVNLLKANFEEIILNYESEDTIKIKMRSGTDIVLKNASQRLPEKFMLALSTYDNLSDKISTHIVCYENSEGSVVGYYY